MVGGEAGKKEGWSERGGREEGRFVSREAGKREDLGKKGMREDCKRRKAGKRKELMDWRPRKGKDVWKEEAGKREGWLRGEAGRGKIS
jgi:hypothetical protein